MAELAKETFLGLDIGTSSVKALLVDVEQRTVGEASIPLSVSRPHPLWSEQNPSDWVEGSRGGGRDDPPRRAIPVRGVVWHRPLGPDAWRNPARRAGPTAQTRNFVERRAVVRRMR